MAYIPKDAKWYIAELVMECKIEGESQNVVHVNIILIRADSPEEAFEKAQQFGTESEDSYLNPKNQQVSWRYRGLRDLNVIHDELEDGAELMFEEKIDIPEDEVQEMLTSKYELNVFCPIEPRDSSQPNYCCQEIIEEALKIIADDAAQNN